MPMKAAAIWLGDVPLSVHLHSQAEVVVAAASCPDASIYSFGDSLSETIKDDASTSVPWEQLVLVILRVVEGVEPRLSISVT
ncbi:hypothetical protein F4803DRAFT_551127 [Xylaria telfairii]|nr:hypothetical protein F4803DRAFT_551127 [Xylaria telfairii]